MTNLANFGYKVVCQLLPDKAVFPIDSWQFDEANTQMQVRNFFASIPLNGAFS